MSPIALKNPNVIVTSIMQGEFELAIKMINLSFDKFMKQMVKKKISKRQINLQ